MPNLYIRSGCNGAGKTTASYTILPDILDCREFVNADNIAAGISPFNVEAVAVEGNQFFLLFLNYFQLFCSLKLACINLTCTPR